ncbi:fimbrial protein [Aeromonas salmonicida]
MSQKNYTFTLKMIALLFLMPRYVFSACDTPLGGDLVIPPSVTFTAGETEKIFVTVFGMGSIFPADTRQCSLTTTYMRGVTSGNDAYVSHGVTWSIFHNINDNDGNYGQYYTNPATTIWWGDFLKNRVYVKIRVSRPYTRPSPIPAGPVGSIKLTGGGSLGYLQLPNPVSLNVVGCALTKNDADIDLGNVNASTFSGVGTTAGPKKEATFQIDCGNVQTNTIVTLTGTPDTDNNTVLALNGVAGLKASGVGVQLSVKGPTNTTGVVTPLGTGVSLGQLPPGLNTFSIGAQYIQTATAIRGGQANASATLNITYQ